MGTDNCFQTPGAARTIRDIRALPGTAVIWKSVLLLAQHTTYALLIPPVDDAYEVYWNGKLIGSYGKLPPRPHWYYTSLFRAFAVPSADSGTIAIRVWKSPLLFVDPGSLGGMKWAARTR